MAYSAKQIATSLSTIYLLVLTCLASYALHLTSWFSLPIPITLAAFAVALPLVAGCSLMGVFRLCGSRDDEITSHRTDTSSSIFSFVTALLLIIYGTTISVLSITYLGPAKSLDCGLSEKWRSLYQAKEAESIKTIQDTLDCCGFRTVADMPFPFPAKDVLADACHLRFNREKACLDDWREREQVAAGFMLLVAILSFIWILIAFIIFYKANLSRRNSTIRSGFIDELDYDRDEQSIQDSIRPLLSEHA